MISSELLAELRLEEGRIDEAERPPQRETVVPQDMLSQITTLFQRSALVHAAQGKEDEASSCSRRARLREESPFRVIERDALERLVRFLHAAGLRTRRPPGGPPARGPLAVAA